MKHDIRFLSEGKTLAGHLYIPDGIQPDDRLPAVVVAAPGSGIKAQTAGIYAEALSRRGIVALAFDQRTYGAGEEYPRLPEDPSAKDEDIKQSVRSLDSRKAGTADRHAHRSIGQGVGWIVPGK